MDARPKHHLDNPTLRGRIRGSRQPILLNRPHSAQFNGRMSDVGVSPKQPMAASSKIVLPPAPTVKATESAPRPHDQTPRATGRAGIDIKKSAATTNSAPKLSREPKPRPDLPKQHRSTVLKRHMLKPLVYTPAKKHRRPLVPTLLNGLAATLFLMGAFVLINTLRTNHSVKAQVKVLGQNTESEDGISEGIPSEANPPSAAGNSNYQVSPDLPRILTIDKIGVSARVRRVGVGPNNIMNAPANIFDVGWYDGSAKPGDNGTIVLDGHVSGPTKHGVFYSLGTLRPGDKIGLERGDGKQFNYTVTDVKVYDDDKVDMSQVVTSSVPGKPGLNLMTCTGQFNVRTNKFEQRVVVFSVED